MSRKAIGLAVFGLGLGIALVSALADVIGLGRYPTAFGYRQIIGTSGGAVIAVVGILLWRRGKRPG